MQHAVLPVDQDALVAAAAARCARLDVGGRLARSSASCTASGMPDSTSTVPPSVRPGRPVGVALPTCSTRGGVAGLPARSCRSRSGSPAPARAPAAACRRPSRRSRSHGLPSFVTIAGMIVWNGRLCGSRRLRCVVVEGEQRAAVLQREAQVARHDAGAEAEVVALDQRAAVAVLVDDATGRSCRRAPASGRPAGTSVARLRRGRSACGAASAYSFEISSATGSLAERRVGVEAWPGRRRRASWPRRTGASSPADVGPIVLQVVRLRAG